MAKKAEFDLTAFQSEVIDAYAFLKNIERNARESGVEKAFGQKGRVGCLGQFFRYPVVLKGLRAMEKKAVKSYYESAGTIEHIRRSKELIFDARVRAILCPLIVEAVPPGMPAEETELALIRTITAALTPDKIASQYSIKLDPFLFAHMVKHIMEHGVGSFCAGDTP